MQAFSEKNEVEALRQEVQLLRSQVAHLQRLTALGELVGTTTHEFNNVLTTIINYAKLGLRNKDEASRNKAFDRILSASGRGAKISTGVLAFSRNRSGAKEPTDLKRLIEDVLLLLEREMTRYRVKITTKFSEVPFAMAIGNEIQQVLINLLTNARQAMSDGGKIEVSLASDLASGFVDICIVDNGPGIPADKLPRIFEPFYSTKSGPDATGKGGAGLGLSACKLIIEGHNGRLRVESTPGVGASFTIRLPIAPGTTGSSQTKAAETTVTPSSSLPGPNPGLLGSSGRVSLGVETASNR